MSDKVLTYLQGDSQGARRDLIAHCYYDAAQGDPKSGPVVFAVLLDACAEQFAKTPQELVKATADFQQVVTKAADLESRMIERTDQNNAAVVAEFKDETRRANDTLREIVGLGNITIDRGKRIDQQLKPIATHLERIGVDLYLLKDDLKDNRESARRTAEAADNIQTLHQENRALVKRLGKESRANWITVGLLAGICLSAVFTLLPWWGGSLSFVVVIALIQMAFSPVVGLSVSLVCEAKEISRAIQACGLNNAFSLLFLFGKLSALPVWTRTASNGGWLLRLEVNLKDIREFIVFL